MWISENKVLYVKFSTELNYSRTHPLISSGKSPDRIKLQKIASHLNSESVNNYIKKRAEKSEFKPNHIEYFAVNNSALFYFDETKKKNPKIKLPSEIPKDNLVVALLDSGVSTNHEALVEYKVTQFNSRDNSYGEKDSGLGHATGILSLLRESPSPHKPSQKQNISFLSCNGITDGKYHFLTALRCFNWLFNQPKVDIMLNAWLVSEPGCKQEWDYPIQMLWMSGTIPIFAAGNNGLEKQQSYSPANLSSLGTDLPLISVGALSESGRRLENSSHATSQCGEPHPLTSLYANGENLKVAVPFQYDSYQTVSGTSYAIAFVANALLELKSIFPKQSNKELVLALFYSAKDLGKKGVDNQYGFGELNLPKAIERIEREEQSKLSTAVIKR